VSWRTARELAGRSDAVLDELNSYAVAEIVSELASEQLAVKGYIFSPHVFKRTFLATMALRRPTPPGDFYTSFEA